MHICYIDEAGCPGMLPAANSMVQPVLVLTALFVPQEHLSKLTRDFLLLKRQFNPNLTNGSTHWLDIAKCEIKGSDLRSSIRNSGRNRRRAVFGFLDRTIDLLLECEAKFVARIYIKGPAKPFDGKAVYTSSVQNLCSCFQSCLNHKDSHGFVIADSRTAALNSNVSHSIFTQKFKTSGDAYNRILDMPTFGHSENHVPIQITDFLASTILSPMATHIYCAGHINSTHVHAEDYRIKERYIDKIRALSYRFNDGTRVRGGVTIIDGIANRSAALLFSQAP